MTVIIEADVFAVVVVIVCSFVRSFVYLYRNEFNVSTPSNWLAIST